MQVGDKRHAPVVLPLGKRLDAPCTGGWVIPRAGLDNCENLTLTGIRSPDCPARS